MWFIELSPFCGPIIKNYKHLEPHNLTSYILNLTFLTHDDIAHFS